VDQPDCITVTKRLVPPQRADTQKVSTSMAAPFGAGVSKRIVGLSFGSRVQTLSAATAWTPTQSTSVACAPQARERLTFATDHSRDQLPPRGVAVTWPGAPKYACPLVAEARGLPQPAAPPF